MLSRLGSGVAGLTSAEAARRLDLVGPNAVRTHRVRAPAILFRQVRNPLLLLLLAAATVALVVGDRNDAIIIVAIVTLSVGLGFVNEYRSEQAVEALHSKIRHRVSVVREGRILELDVVDVVPGDVVHLRVGDVVPADLRLLEANGLACDESVLTGESVPVAKSTDPVRGEPSTHELGSCALMGTVVRAGAGAGVVVGTGSATEFGRIALRLGDRPSETAFQAGLRDFSRLLVGVAGVLTVAIFVINVALRRPLIDALLFSLAIAIGLTPQLLPAIVTVSLSTGTRALARRKVVVKRLVAIEDLANIDLLFTDKTGTLTEGAVAFAAALDAEGRPSDQVLRLGLVCTDVVVQDGRVVEGSPLDRALWEPVSERGVLVGSARLLDLVPFDHERRMMTGLVEDDGRRFVITKGAPEAIFQRCDRLPTTAEEVFRRAFDAGSRVVAVAQREVPADQASVSPADERDLELVGLLSFVDPPKADAGRSLARLAALGIAVKVVTGDNERVARAVAEELGLAVGATLTGSQLDRMSNEQLEAALPGTGIFARVDPEQKSRIIRVAQGSGADVAFLGDGANDAIALHDADVGISVDSATDVAKAAADIVLLEKDLGVVADGVAEGRRIFANTVKYVLMASSSNVGNMFSAAAASLFLPFLPMLPTQILLNNLLYDAGQMTIPTDRVDEELLERPAHWDVRLIRRFMGVFGPISSAFDFVTFAVLLLLLHAAAPEFRSGWFVESLATQTLIVFVIRTRRVPFLRSLPSLPMLVAMIGVAALGVLLPFSFLAEPFGFVPLPLSFLAILVVLVVAYLVLAEAVKARFYAVVSAERPIARRRSRTERRVRRVASRFSHPRRLGGARGG